MHTVGDSARQPAADDLVRAWLPDRGPAPLPYLLTGCAILAVAASHLIPDLDGLASRLAFHVVAGIGLVWVALGAWRHRRHLGLVGALALASVVLQYVGDSAWTLNLLVLHDELWPSWTHLFFLPSYITLLIAAMVMVRRRERHRNVSAFIDAGMITIGVAVVWYAFVIVDAATASGDDVTIQALGVSYAVCDVLIVGVVARMTAGSAGPSGAVLLFGGAMVALLVGDLGVSIEVYAGGAANYQHWVDAAYLMFYLLMGRALRHPEVGTLLEPSGTPRDGMSSVRMAVLGAGVLLAPLTLLVPAVSDDPVKVRGAAIGGALLFLLALVRMALLLRDGERTSALLEIQARTDALTQLPNRRTFDHALSRSVEAARVDMLFGPLSVAMMDLDSFKLYNDSRGHVAGDELLQSAAAAWSGKLTYLAPAATLARYGGEEFAIVLPGADERAAAAVLRHLLLLTPGGQTCSAGVAQWDRDEDAGSVLARADARLYQAKSTGRGRVVASPPLPQPGRAGSQPS